MEQQLVYTLTNNFEDFSHTTDNGVEFWLARDLQQLLNYTQWRNFELVINKASYLAKRFLIILLTSAKR